MPSSVETFFIKLSESILAGKFIKLTLSKRRSKDGDLKNIFVKPVELKSGINLQFVYRHPTKDITKNYSTGEALQLLQQMLVTDFYNADLFTTENDFRLLISKNEKQQLLQQPATIQKTVSPEHDKKKKRYISTGQNIYLHELGITSTEGKVKSDKQDKFRQINKYVEIVDGIVQSASLSNNFRVADMGAGKGYLTFALYDYLTNILNLQPEVTGVEFRDELVNTCNVIATKAGFTKLNFKTGSIDTTELPATDMLIALHACDIATDQAIYRGIQANAKVIICAPCCHKQIRKQLKPATDLKAISKFGIMEERQAEILTDTIRALILEAFGYKTKVFEFISTEHTPKNIMLTAVKTKATQKVNSEVLEEIKRLKQQFGIEEHYLEKLMQI